MISCESPIQLKNGLIAPCGKCLLCLSARRDEWSVRLQMHSAGFDSMPFFLTLTYDNDHLVYGDDRCTLVPSDLRLFIKRLRDRYALYNSDFGYFGCGEYGDGLRAHYHLIVFGFDYLRDVYERSWQEANDLIRSVWQKGFVDVCIAKWSGIHYVTKYVLKLKDDDYKGIQKPFIVWSNGLSLPWLDTREGRFVSERLRSLREIQLIPLHLSGDIRDLRSSALDALHYAAYKIPKFSVELPNGNKASLPRYIRKKLIGQFDYFMDNPLWQVNYYRQLVQSTDYLLAHGDYDRESLQSYASQVNALRSYKIRQRLIIKDSQK